jgi:hypothetical protein
MTQLVDFLFTGVAVLPGALLLSGHPDLAMMSFWPLLIAACLTSVRAGDHAAADQTQPLRSRDAVAENERAPSRVSKEDARGEG